MITYNLSRLICPRYQIWSCSFYFKISEARSTWFKTYIHPNFNTKTTWATPIIGVDSLAALMLMPNSVYAEQKYILALHEYNTTRINAHSGFVTRQNRQRLTNKRIFGRDNSELISSIRLHLKFLHKRLFTKGAHHFLTRRQICD